MSGCFPKKCLFVIGHMRSYSTVLSHILGSHEQIVGYREHHQGYNSERHLWKVAFQQLKEQPLAWLHATYQLDKLLHNHLSVKPELHTRYDCKFIVLVRRPAATVDSLMRLFLPRLDTMAPLSQKNPIPKDNQEAVQYFLLHYIARLEKITEWSPSFITQSTLVCAEEFASQPEQVLATLTHFLKLDRPLTGEYKLFPRSGTTRHGDNSPRITLGRLGFSDLEDSKRASEERLHAITSHPLFDTAERVYDQCCNSYQSFQ